MTSAALVWADGPRIETSEPVRGLLVDGYLSEKKPPRDALVESDVARKENVVGVRWADGPKVETAETVVGLLRDGYLSERKPSPDFA